MSCECCYHGCTLLTLSHDPLQLYIRKLREKKAISEADIRLVFSNLEEVRPFVCV